MGEDRGVLLGLGVLCLDGAEFQLGGVENCGAED